MKGSYMTEKKPTRPNEVSQRFDQLVSRQWEAWMSWDPLFATTCGDMRYNDRLPDAGEAHYSDWRGQLVTFRAELNKIDPQALMAPDKLNYDIFSRMLDYEIGALDFHGYRLPLSKAGGFHTYLPDLQLLIPVWQDRRL